MNNKKTLLFTTLACLLPVALVILFYNKFPDTIEIYPNGDNMPSEFIEKKTLLYFPILSTISSIIINILTDKIFFNRHNITSIIKWVLPAISIAFSVVLILKYAIFI